MDDVKKVCDYGVSLNNFLHKNGSEGYIYQPDCASTVLKLLHAIFEDEDKNGWICYYSFDLDFGRKWKAGMVTDENGKDIALSSAEELYDFLTQNKEVMTS